MYAPDQRLSRRRAAQRGLSIIELMVGIVVALLVGLAATGSAVMFTATQRQGIGAGGVAVNATTVMSAIKNDVASAGLGFFGDSKYLCNSLNLSVAAAKVSDGAAFSPIQVTRGADFDQLDVVYASRVESGANVLLKSASTGVTAELMSYLPVAAGDAVLLAPQTPGTPCTVRSVTANTASTAEAAQVLAFADDGRHNAAAFATAPAYGERGRVTLLGDLRWNRYRVVDGNLVLERPLDGTSAILVRNVVGFRMEYGTSAAAAGSTTLEDWVDPTSTWSTISSANIARVRALRVGLIVRSPQREKPDANGNCSASETRPVLFDNAAENLDADDWNCFRYRTASVVVPMRNLVMGLRP